jgi:hypothetical protein
MVLIRITSIIFAIVIVANHFGCGQQINDPHLATEPYPRDQHTPNVADIQVFRDGTKLEIVNSTAHSYRDFDLWLNQRYVRRVDALDAGETITLSLWDFRDEYGDTFSAGGFFRAYEPTPVRMAEIQPAPGHDMIGLITIRAEEVRVKPEPGRE